MPCGLIFRKKPEIPVFLYETRQPTPLLIVETIAADENDFRQSRPMWGNSGSRIMRLTLRTLLAYLDDILEPAQTKEIGAKISESAFAMSLATRIREVMRQRRLTAPELVDENGLDANVTAEYLDNTLPPDDVAEVEKKCLESDVHLAEVSASHQILTLVLGEPVEIAPETRERMYALANTAPTDGAAAKQTEKPAPKVAAAAVAAVAVAAEPHTAASVKPIAGVRVAPKRQSPQIPAYLRQRPLWRRALPVVVVAGIVTAFIWLVLNDKGLPFSASSDSNTKSNVATNDVGNQQEPSNEEVANNDKQAATEPGDDANVAANDGNKKVGFEAAPQEPPLDPGSPILATDTPPAIPAPVNPAPSVAVVAPQAAPANAGPSIGRPPVPGNANAAPPAVASTGQPNVAPRLREFSRPRCKLRRRRFSRRPLRFCITRRAEFCCDMTNRRTPTIGTWCRTSQSFIPANASPQSNRIQPSSTWGPISFARSCRRAQRSQSCLPLKTGYLDSTFAAAESACDGRKRSRQRQKTRGNSRGWISGRRRCMAALKLLTDDAVCGIDVIRRQPDRFELLPGPKTYSAVLFVVGGTVRIEGANGQANEIAAGNWLSLSPIADADGQAQCRLRRSKPSVGCRIGSVRIAKKFRRQFVATRRCSSENSNPRSRSITTCPPWSRVPIRAYRNWRHRHWRSPRVSTRS